MPQYFKFNGSPCTEEEFNRSRQIEASNQPRLMTTSEFNDFCRNRFRNYNYLMPRIGEIIELSDSKSGTRYEITAGGVKEVGVPEQPKIEIHDGFCDCHQPKPKSNKFSGF